MRTYLRKLKSSLLISTNSPYFYRLETYSQEGEDIILRKLFHGQTSGFYVDVGAHHPYRYSNTFWFYRRGWKGLNIDATPGSMKDFTKTRPRDINIETAVGKSKKSIPYYLFSDSAFNTMSKPVADALIKNNRTQLIQTVHIPSRPLSDILDESVPENTAVDFFNIDVEGKDLEILETNNWQKYIPRVICIEVGSDVLSNDLPNHPIGKQLKTLGYSPAAKLFNSAIFIQNPNAQSQR